MRSSPSCRRLDFNVSCRSGLCLVHSGKLKGYCPGRVGEISLKLHTSEMRITTLQAQYSPPYSHSSKSLDELHAWSCCYAYFREGKGTEKLRTSLTQLVEEGRNEQRWLVQQPAIIIIKPWCLPLAMFLSHCNSMGRLQGLQWLLRCI